MKNQPEEKKEKKYYLGFSGKANLQRTIDDIDMRLNEIEAKVLRTSRKTTTNRAKQILLLHKLGLLQKIIELGLSSRKNAKLLSILLNASEDNIKGDLTNIYQKNSYFKTSENYSFLLDTFKELGLKDHAKEADIELDKIIKKEDKIK